MKDGAIDTNRYADVITLPGGYTQAISADSIIATGQSHHFMPTPMTWDMSLKDSLNGAVGSIEQNVMSDIMTDPEVVAFLKLQEGAKTTEDYEAFEHRLSKFISVRMDEIPAFDRYRSRGNNPLTSDQNVNNLSTDINNGTMNVQIHCQTYSIIHSVLAQKIENQLANTDEFNISPSQYYVMTGVVDQRGGNIGGHSYVVSSRTGAIIEATADPDFGAQNHNSYLRTAVNFNEIIAGKPIIASSYEHQGATLGIYTAGVTTAKFDYTVEDYAPRIEVSQIPQFSAGVKVGMLPTFGAELVGSQGFEAPAFSAQIGPEKFTIPAFSYQFDENSTFETPKLDRLLEGGGNNKSPEIKIDPSIQEYANILMKDPDLFEGVQEGIGTFLDQIIGRDEIVIKTADGQTMQTVFENIVAIAGNVGSQIVNSAEAKLSRESVETAPATAELKGPSVMI